MRGLGVAAACVLGTVTVVGAAGAVGMGSLLSSMFWNIPMLPPTAKQLDEEDLDRCLLFRHVPELRGKLAWREIGEYPTPIHICTIAAPDEEGINASFYVKREDLSSPDYGGNKVRTLQHQLACCEAYSEQNPGARFHVFGSGGSNQAVATTLHGTKHFRVSVNCLWAMPDSPDLDNTLNMLSALSMPGDHIPWIRPLSLFKNLLGSVLGLTADKVFNAGGNSLPGLLGQVSAALELAEQIKSGQVPDPDAIYIAVGSSCTLTGLIVGISLARALPALRSSAFTNPALKIVAVPIHHGPAAMHRNFNFFKSSISSLLAVTPRHGIFHTCHWLSASGGPDVKASAEDFLANHVEFVADKDVVGAYGKHSKKSAWASTVYDQHGAMHNHQGVEEDDLWLCGHFAAKPFAVILERAAAQELKARPGADPCRLNIIMWQTKSAVQPRGPRDEWDSFSSLRESSASLRKWADEGKAQSSLRKGEVSTESGPDGYRHLMKPVDMGDHTKQ